MKPIASIYYFNLKINIFNNYFAKTKVKIQQM